jgi:hypothetical protein
MRILSILAREKGLDNKDFSGGYTGSDHPFPFRTRKLSLPGPMVLHLRGCGRVGRRLNIVKARLARRAFC